MNALAGASVGTTSLPRPAPTWSGPSWCRCLCRPASSSDARALGQRPSRQLLPRFSGQRDGDHDHVPLHRQCSPLRHNGHPRRGAIHPSTMPTISQASSWDRLHGDVVSDSRPRKPFVILLQTNVLDREVWATREDLCIVIAKQSVPTTVEGAKSLFGRLMPINFETVMTPTATQAAYPKISHDRAAELHLVPYRSV